MDIFEYGSYATQLFQVDDFHFKNSIKYRRFLYRATWNKYAFSKVLITNELGIAKCSVKLAIFNSLLYHNPNS